MKGLVTVHDAERNVRSSVFLDAAPDLPLGSVIIQLATQIGIPVTPDLSGSVDGFAINMGDESVTVESRDVHEGSWFVLWHANSYPKPNAPDMRAFDPRVSMPPAGSVTAQLRVVGGWNAGAVYDLTPGIMDVRPILDPASQASGVSLQLEVSDTYVTARPGVRLVEEPDESPRRGLRRRKKTRQVPHSGMYIDGEELVEPRMLANTDVIEMPGCLLRVSMGREAYRSLPTDEASGRKMFSRPPKMPPERGAHKYNLPSEPTPPTKASLPIVSCMLPLAMAIAMWLMMNSRMYLLFGLMSPIMMFASWITNNRQGRKRYKNEVAKYEATVARFRNDAAHGIELERQYARQEYPDPTEVMDMCVLHTDALWNRRLTNDSWMSVRVGTGEMASHVVIVNPSKLEFEREEEQKLYDQPVRVSLAQLGCVGLAGKMDVIAPVSQWIVMQLAALHSVKNLQLYLLTPHEKMSGKKTKKKQGAQGKTMLNASRASMQTGDAPDEQSIDWSFMEWLPHFAPQEGQNSLRSYGQTAADLASRISELTSLIDARAGQLRQESMKKWNGPCIVVVMDKAHILRSMPGAVRILREGPQVGIYALCVESDERLLPEECQSLVIVDEDGKMRVMNNDGSRFTDVMPDVIAPQWLNQAAMALAPIMDATPSESDSAIPASSRLLDVLHLTPKAAEIEQSWAGAVDPTRFTIGESVDGPFSLDIAKDGPHALIGGTTGSGKSEFLQSLVASLSVVNRPDMLNFVLVDYKGGSAFKDCVRLPHTVGMVTDLDTHLVSRALTSLGAELTRREHILADADVKDIDDYLSARLIRKDLAPLPRLVIIIDEFASLARELPDFVKGLVNIAQRGRSLGIHLILATQRPGGVVSPEIRANTNLRIALRMTDAGESTDVIGAKDAALISKSTPGRAVVRLGSNSLIPFQSSRVGGRYVAVHGEAKPKREAPFARVITVGQLGQPMPERPKKKEDKGSVDITDLTELVDAIGEATKDLGIPEQRKPWLPALPTRLDLNDLAGFSATEPTSSATGLSPIPFALVDHPQQQSQTPSWIDLQSMGNLFIIGTTKSGKTTALRTIAYAACMRMTPRYLHIYAIDAGAGGLRALSTFANVGGVVGNGEDEKVEKLIRLLSRLLGERRSLLSAGGFGSIDEYNKAAGGMAKGRVLPHVLVLLDSWDSFFNTYQLSKTGIIDRIKTLMQEGPSLGIHFIVSGDRKLISGSMSILGDRKIALHMIDKMDYASIGMRSGEVPDDMPSGRGFSSEDASELQIAVIDKDLDGREETEAIRAKGEELSRTRDAVCAAAELPHSVELLPESVMGSVWMRSHPDLRLLATQMPIGIGGDDNELITWDFAAYPILKVVGSHGTGKSTVCVQIAGNALRGGWTVVPVLGRSNSPLATFARNNGLTALSDPAAMTQAAFEAFLPDAASAAAGRKTMFLIDDEQELINIMAAPWLIGIIKHEVPRGTAFVVAGDTKDFTGGFNTWGSELMARVQCGILLGSLEPAEYNSHIGVPFPAVKALTAHQLEPQGRGFLHAGKWMGLIQCFNASTDSIR